MSTRKTADLAVKVGTYPKDGKDKNKYRNCGIVITADDGGEMLMIDPLFNFAAVPRDAGRDYVILSKFEVKDENKAAPAPAATPQFEE